MVLAVIDYWHHAQRVIRDMHKREAMYLHMYVPTYDVVLDSSST